MPWPTFSPTPGNVVEHTGSGFLLAAPLGTPFPSFTAAGGKFTNSWDAAWVNLGRTTEDGITWSFGQDNASYTSSQEFYPFLSKVTGKTVNCSFTLYEYNKYNMQVALNGGNWGVTGSGLTEIATYTPALPGAEIYTQLAWIGTGDQEVILMYKCFSSAEVSMEMKRDDPRPLAMNMQAVQPDAAISALPFRIYGAGGVYGA